MKKIAGSESGSNLVQRHGSADQDLDPHQNVMDPHHWFFVGVLKVNEKKAGSESADPT
jgi:hypothetical protein